MKTIVKKLCSRKLWLAIAGIAGGIAIALGATSAEVATAATTVQVAIGGVMTVISAVVYIYTEGKIDAASVQTGGTAAQMALAAVQEFIKLIKGAEENAEAENAEAEKLVDGESAGESDA